MRPIKTLKEYESKYKSHNKNLLKISKKEVIDFDTINDCKGENALLKHRKWVLLGDSYYEIPRPIRWTWFKSLNAGVQIATCALLAGAVGGGAYGTYYLLTRNSTKVILEGGLDNYFKLAEVKKDNDGNTIIKLENTKSLESGYKIDVYVGDKQLMRDSDYTLTNDGNNIVITIIKSVIDSNPGNIVLKPVEQKDEKISKSKWDAAVKKITTIEDRNYRVLSGGFEDDESDLYYEGLYFLKGNDIRMPDIDEDSGKEVEGGSVSYETADENGNYIIKDEFGLSLNPDSAVAGLREKFLNLEGVYDDVTFNESDKSYFYSITKQDEYGYNVTLKYTVKFDENENISYIKYIEEWEESTINAGFNNYIYTFDMYGDVEFDVPIPAESIIEITPVEEATQVESETSSFEAWQSKIYNIDISSMAELENDKYMKITLCQDDGTIIAFGDEPTVIFEHHNVMYELDYYFVDDDKTYYISNNSITELEGSKFSILATIGNLDDESINLKLKIELNVDYTPEL